MAIESDKLWWPRSNVRLRWQRCGGKTKICFDFYYLISRFLLFRDWKPAEVSQLVHWKNAGSRKTFCDFYEIYIWFSLLKIPEGSYDELLTGVSYFFYGGQCEIHVGETSWAKRLCLRHRKNQNAEKILLHKGHKGHFFLLFIHSVHHRSLVVVIVL